MIANLHDKTLLDCAARNCAYRCSRRREAVRDHSCCSLSAELILERSPDEGCLVYSQRPHSSVVVGLAYDERSHLLLGHDLVRQRPTSMIVVLRCCRAWLSVLLELALAICMV